MLARACRSIKKLSCRFCSLFHCLIFYMKISFLPEVMVLINGTYISISIKRRIRTQSKVSGIQKKTKPKMILNQKKTFIASEL
ncbi:Hypothetical predicted protein, partial [Mytilus galloprovincialis]